MRLLRKGISTFIMIVFIIQAFCPSYVNASLQIDFPKGLDVEKDGAGKLKIYRDDRDKNHVTLKWNVCPFPADGDILEKGYKLFTSEDGGTSFSEYQGLIRSNQSSLEITAHGTQELKSGTIYQSRLSAFHRHEGSTMIHESLRTLADTAIFMTDIVLKAETVGTDAIQLKWDDVMYGNQRIDYDIYVSDSSSFPALPTFSAKKQYIGSGNPVTPIIEGGRKKLSYTARGLKAGTVYYFKIKPIVNDSKVMYNPETSVVVGTTMIVATISRVSGDWWRIKWNPITNPTLEPGKKPVYAVRRGDSSPGNDQLPVALGETTDTKFYVNISNLQYYYFVETIVEDQIDGSISHSMQSEILTGVEAEVPAKPQVPEVKDEIRKFYPNGEVRYSLKESLKATEATIAWLPPKLINGSIDTNVVYDIYLLTDPDDIDNESAVKVQANYSVPPANCIYLNDGSNEIIGYKYTFTGLVPNRTYYFKAVAKKHYNVDEEGNLNPGYVESDPALKVIVTPATGPIDQPIALSKPPFRVKTTSNGKLDIGKDYTVLEWENKWWEEWKDNKWNYIPEEDFNVADSVYTDKYRHVVYDEGITYNIGYTEFPENEDGIDYDELVRNKPIKISEIPNDLDNGNILQSRKVTGLTPNTAYIFWMMAYRDSEKSQSEPSDPVIIVTKPSVTEPIEKPTVPKFTYNNPGDIFAELLWTSKSDFTYYIKYGTSDDISAAQNSVTVKPEDLKKSSVYKLTGLKNDTTYYFWIQADSTGNRIEDGMSFWSDSYIVKTLPYTPPDTPKGFGIKNSTTAIDKNSITFEWMKVQGLEYILELSSDTNYTDSKEYNAGATGEYTVTDLRSNYRYWARLYAYDPVKKLRSEHTQSITIKTLRSGDDYDSDVDTDNVITGPFVEEKYSDGVWKFSVVGVNAERLVEKVQTDKILDYKFDLTDEPSANMKKRVILVSSKVFDALSGLKENVVIDTGFSKFTVRPNTMNSEQANQMLSKTGSCNFEITITESSLYGDTGNSSLSFKTKPVTISVNMVNGTQVVPMESFNNPLKVVYTFTEENSFADTETNGYYFDSSTEEWTKKEAVIKYDKMIKKGSFSFDIPAPGKSAVMRTTGYTNAFFDLYGHPASEEVAAIYIKYGLKSVEKGKFRPDSNITKGEAARIVMDILGHEYSQDYAEAAAKAGLINPWEISDIDTNCTRSQLQKMVDRLYEIKTGEKAKTGVASGSANGTISRGEAMVKLYNILLDIGEI